MFIFNLHCQLVLHISGNTLHKNMLKCKIPIVPEEGWFGQPKYSTLCDLACVAGDMACAK